MKLKTFLLIILLFSALTTKSQNYHLIDTSFTACSGTLFDSGGDSNYENNSSYITTICSGNEQQINLDFTSFITESTFDKLSIYDGTNSSNSVLLGTFSGLNSPGLITAISGCITLRFVSDGTIDNEGFKANISCGKIIHGPNLNHLINLVGDTNVCYGIIFDPGYDTNYADNQNYTRTFCSGNNSQINLDFTSFHTEPNYDKLLLFDGISTSSNPMGVYSGISSPGFVTSTNGCITLNFISDNSVTYSGFEAVVSCVNDTCFNQEISIVGPTSFCKGDSVKLFVPDSESSGYSQVLISISDTSFLDEISWKLSNSLGDTVAFGGPYLYSYEVNSALILTNGPYYFRIESTGLNNDNTPSFQLRDFITGTILESGNLIGGSTYISNAIVGPIGQIIVNEWSPQHQLNNILANIVSASPEITTTFVVTSTNILSGCLSKDSITIIIPDTIPAPVISNYTTITASPDGQVYQWYNCGNNEPIVDETNINFIPIENGTYYVEITDTLGCIQNSSCVTINSVGINENKAEANVSVYPNPTKGKINLTIPTEQANVSVYSTLGKVIANYSNIQNGAVIDLSNNPNGVYLIHVATEKGTSILRVVRN